MHIMLIINKYFSIYSIQSYIYTRHVFFAHLPFQTHDPIQPAKNKNFRPIPDPTQPNPLVNLTHGQLCGTLPTN